MTFFLQIDELEWSSVTGWVGQGGANLGANRKLPEKYITDIVAQLKKNNIQALLIIGGFEVIKIR